MCVASPIREANPSHPNIPEEGEIPQSEHQASPARVEPTKSVPPSAPQSFAEAPPHQSSTMPDKASVPDEVSAPSPLRISLDVAKRNSDVDPSAAKSVSAHHSDSVIYGDEVISVEDELKYPHPREQLSLFSIGVSVKGLLFNQHASSVLSRVSIHQALNF